MRIYDFGGSNVQPCILCSHSSVRAIILLATCINIESHAWPASNPAWTGTDLLLVQKRNGLKDSRF